MYNWFNYSFLFFKLWGLNKLMLGVPYYLIKHLIIEGVINITYKSGKFLLYGIGSGIYYIAFPKPIEITNIDDELKEELKNKI